MNPIILSLIVLAFSLPAKSTGPSFDCKKAQSEIEKTICSSSELMQLDIELSEKFKSSNTPLEKKNQLAWIKERNQKCRGDGLLACLKESYVSRIKQLSQPAAAESKLTDVWKLMAPYKESEFYSPEVESDPMNPSRLVLRGIEKEERTLLVAIFEKSASGLKLLAKDIDDHMDNVAPEEAILSSSRLNPGFSKLSTDRSSYGINAGFTFDSTSTHCGTDKLMIFVLTTEGLVKVFEQVLSFTCNDEKKERTKVTVDSGMTKGSHDLLVTTGKKVVRYKWNGEYYSK